MNENERNRQRVTDPAEHTGTESRVPEGGEPGEAPGEGEAHARRAAAL
ncbi:threonine aldolase, partial [Streptomyces albidoflavus]